MIVLLSPSVSSLPQRLCCFAPFASVSTLDYLSIRCLCGTSLTYRVLPPLETSLAGERTGRTSEDAHARHAQSGDCGTAALSEPQSLDFPGEVIRAWRKDVQISDVAVRACCFGRGGSEGTPEQPGELAALVQTPCQKCTATAWRR